MKHHPTDSVPHVILLMGTMSSGKTHFGKLLAKQLGWHFHEGDTDHAPEMKAKMRACIPLTDKDRSLWLKKIRNRIRQWHRAEQNTVVTCSALKRTYRDTLRVAPLHIVHCHAPPDILNQRAHHRAHEYMCPGLVDSQLATLEPPGNDEHAISVNTNQPEDHVIEYILAELAKGGITPQPTRVNTNLSEN